MSRVTIARHVFFYKTFFNKHKEFLEELCKISHTSLKDGHNKLNVFYGSYSYYLKEHDKDNHLKELMKESKGNCLADKEYAAIVNKIKMGGLGTLTYEELCLLNQDFNKYLKEILEIFEIFCYRFAPSDIFPKITSNSSEYDLNLLYVIYDTFYESLFNLHAKIHTTLLDFNILDFVNMFQQLQVFFYGYSYYLKKDTIKELKDMFNDLYKYYNDETFLKTYYNLIQGSVNEDGLALLNEYRDKMFESCIDIFEKINGDLPKSNLFPIRAEKVMVDMTLI